MKSSKKPNGVSDLPKRTKHIRRERKKMEQKFSAFKLKIKGVKSERKIFFLKNEHYTNETKTNKYPDMAI